MDDMIYGIISWGSIPRALLYAIRGVGGYHLWFIYTLIMMYLALPILRIITQYCTTKQIVYLLTLWFVFSLSFAWVEEMGNIISSVSIFSFNFSFEILTGFSGYFLLGYTLSNVNFSKHCKYKILAWVFAVILLIFIIFSDLFFIYKLNISPEIIASPIGIPTCLLSICIFLIVKNWDSPNKAIRTIIFGIAKHSFGIYLVHVFWVSLIFNIFKIDYLLFGWCSICIWSIVISILSYITSAILRKIPYIKELVFL